MADIRVGVANEYVWFLKLIDRFYRKRNRLRKKILTVAIRCPQSGQLPALSLDSKNKCGDIHVRWYRPNDQCVLELYVVTFATRHAMKVVVVRNDIFGSLAGRTCQ